MPEKINQTVLNEALNLANKVLDAILFKNSELENHLYGFLAIAIMLGKEEDIEWVKGELGGFKHSNVPDYRKNQKCFAIQSSRRLTTKNNSSYFDIPIIAGLSKLEHVMKENKNERIVFTVEKATEGAGFSIVKKLAKESIGADFVNIEYFKSEITKLFGKVKIELIERLNLVIQEISYGKIPYGIFQNFQEKVNSSLAESNPKAVTELNIAIEGLVYSEDPERISHVAHACKRLIKAVSDEVFPPRTEDYVMKDGSSRKMGGENYLNRLEAFIDSKNLEDRKFILKKIKILRDLYGETNESINRGTHSIISKQAAEMAVIYSYLILGEIILEHKKTENQEQKDTQLKLE